MYSVGLPSKFHKTVKAPAEWLYEAFSQIFREKFIKMNGEERVFEASVCWKIGATVRIQVIPEGEVSSLKFDFSYRGLVSAAIFLLVVFILLSSILSPSFLALLLIILIIIPLLIYKVSLNINEVLRRINDILLGLESEYARKKIEEDKIRWQSSPKNIEELYRRLCEKHIKTWGSTFTLEYKMREYERQGLTKDEAIRKIAEEEGVF